MSIEKDYHEWKKTDCEYYYDYYRITGAGVIVDCDCLKHCFTCTDCKEYEVKE